MITMCTVCSRYPFYLQERDVYISIYMDRYIPACIRMSQDCINKKEIELESAKKICQVVIKSTNGIAKERDNQKHVYDLYLRASWCHHIDPGTTKSCWVVPFQQNPRFLGRQPQLEDLEKRIFAKYQSHKAAIIPSAPEILVGGAFLPLWV
jgi:hypothetical protein